MTATGSAAVLSIQGDFVKMHGIGCETVLKSTVPKLNLPRLIQDIHNRLDNIAIDGNLCFAREFADRTGEDIKMAAILPRKYRNAVVWGRYIDVDLCSFLRIENGGQTL